ncbi:MAG: EAL domain-containing protein [Lachnospiraceae bacterium]|nr:EAL domain-containing protein [Lachnospiraceae bacterium]
MHITNEFHIAFYAATLTICLTVFLFTFLQKRTDRIQNKIFIIMVFIVMLNALSTTGAAFTEPYAQKYNGAYYSLESFQFLYFFLHTALCPILYYYVLSVTGKSRKRQVIHNIIYALPLIVTEVFVLLNPFFHSLYYYDENMQFTRNWAEYLIYGVAGLYYVLAMTELMFSWNAITLRRRIALIYFFLLSIAGIFIQLVNIDIKSELFAESIALLGVMIAVESEDDRLDSVTNIYNRKALQMDVHNFKIMKESVHMIFIKIINADVIERVTGSVNDDILTEKIADYLKTMVPRYNIYHPNPETFVVIFSDYKNSQIEEIKDKISSRFNEEWDIANSSVLLDAAIIISSMPGELNSIEDVLFVSDSLIPASANKEEIDISWIMRRAEIERAIKRNLREEKFEVYYQPTYNIVGASLHGAEALVRMIDDSIGYISPDEFTPVAEQIGLVEEIDDFVLREVCAFLESGIPMKHGMDCINVNLSVIQCIKPGFFEHIMEIVNEYNIEHAMLNFEITESVGAEDYQVLSCVTKKLKSQGFLLSMDDYGTGYSNMEGIFSLDFDVVKIDKSILWSAEKNSNGRIILKNSINMIHDLGCKILVEGVEKKEHIDMLKKLGVDYLQGFFFSKPVPKNKFLEII